MDKKKYEPELVSVIIPTYNSEKFIEKTVLSALNQTYSNLEIIVVDDCSQDSTCSVVKALSGRDDRIKCLFQEKNHGAAVARNLGIKHAKGRYIAFLDSDDTWIPEKIEKQIEALEKGKPFVYCAYDFVDGNGKNIGCKTKIKAEVTYNDELVKTYISTPTVIYDREFFNDPEMPLRRTGQDYAFWLLLLREASAYGIDEALVHVTRREGSLSKNKFQSLIDVYEVQTKFEKLGKIRAGCNTVRYFFYALNKKLNRNH